jgi:predicted house-cleaning NTP pyrophosphatase (Maf/HAM1 superfamily)
MPTISQRLRAFLSSPKGQRLIEQGQRQLAKPENQQRVRQMLAKMQGGRRR